MKKFLAGTTALVATAIVAGQAQAADPIKLSLGGFAEAWVGYADQEAVGDNDYASATVQQDTEVHFTGSTKLDNGLTVGVTIEMEADSNATEQDEVFVSVASDSLGELQIGVVPGAANAMGNIAPEVGIGNNDGDVENWIASNITNADFANNTLTAGDTGQKVVYYTPNFGGFQVGTSYGIIPEVPASTVNVGGTNTGSDIQYTVAVAYSGDFGGVSVAADAGYELIDNGGTNGTSVNNESVGRAGLNVGVAGFTIGGSYIAKDNVGSVSSKDMTGWDAGVSYATGPYGVSFSYMSLSQDDKTAGSVAAVQEDEKDTWMVSGSYDLGAGVAFKGSVFGADFDDASATGTNALDNDGFGVVAGLEVSF
ncbi:porin [Terasakiella sp. A23]|uniref:porin n=1 Tax=Terasakiella sp. FCG-A23 TaxID=3080561 RepID=UPI00295467F5|nr:porin [Terasakiella sp. A23]MDV7339862.1 porin [Terasakiella sp. A23]